MPRLFYFGICLCVTNQGSKLFVFKWAKPGLFLFCPIFNTITNLVKNMTTSGWCAWDSNPVPQDWRGRRIH